MDIIRVAEDFLLNPEAKSLGISVPELRERRARREERKKLWGALDKAGRFVSNGQVSLFEEYVHRAKLGENERLVGAYTHHYVPENTIEREARRGMPPSEPRFIIADLTEQNVNALHEDVSVGRNPYQDIAVYAVGKNITIDDIMALAKGKK